MARPDPSAELLGTGLALVSVVGFALSGPGAKMAYEGGAEPVTLVAIRYLTNVLAVGLMLLVARRGAALPGRIRFGGLLVGGLLAVEAYLFLAGLARVPVSLGVPIFFTFPLQVALLAALFGIERLTSWRVAALAIAFGGLWLMLGRGEMAVDPAGVALCLAAGTVVACTVVGTDRLMAEHPKLPVAFHMMLGGLALAAVGLAVIGGPVLPTGERGLWGLALTCGGFSLGIVLFYLSIGFIGSVRAAMLANLQPIMSVALAVVLVAERPGPVVLAGGGMILCGILLLHYGDRRTRTRVATS